VLRAVADPRFSYRGEDVVATLERVCGQIGYPKTIRVDQGSEFVSRDLDLWAYQKGKLRVHVIWAIGRLDHATADTLPRLSLLIS
jgi:transposase InsO family protein